MSDKLIGLVLKVAKEQELCFPGNKVIIFHTENEGKRNESAYILNVLNKVSEIYGVSQEEISRITTKNSKAIFSI